MRLFEWLLPKSSGSNLADAEMKWSLTAAGNPTGICRNRRLTVFESDGGWKFCDAQLEQDDDPHFSEVYDSMEAAKYEALAWVSGTASRYKSRSQAGSERRRDKWEALIQKKVAVVSEVKQALGQTDMNVTQLRKLEAKVGSQVRQLGWQISEFYKAGVSDSAISTAEQLEKDFTALADLIATRIEERKSRSKRKPTG